MSKEFYPSISLVQIAFILLIHQGPLRILLIHASTKTSIGRSISLFRHLIMPANRFGDASGRDGHSIEVTLPYANGAYTPIERKASTVSSKVVPAIVIFASGIVKMTLMPGLKG
jgi:hypothetical protein